MQWFDISLGLPDAEVRTFQPDTRSWVEQARGSSKRDPYGGKARVINECRLVLL